MDRIPVPFVYFLPDGFRNADDIADRTVLVFHSHIHNTPVIWLSVKFRVDFHPASAEFVSDIPRKNDICAALFRNAVDYFIVFIDFSVHKYLCLFRI